MEKIIHQLWVGEYVIPEKDYHYAQGIRVNNSSFEYNFWDNYNLPNLPIKIEQLKQLYSKEKKWIELADMLRYYFVYEYGGLYVDCDYEFVKPFDELELDSYDGVVSLVFNPEDITICNSMFGFRKKHPIMKYICEKMYNNGNIMWLGPHFFGEQIKSYLGLNIREHDNVVKEKLENINIRVLDRNIERSKYAIHHYSYTWNPESKEKLKIDKNFKL
jgi:mannosyltransferase OCH1-like enzyme